MHNVSLICFPPRKVTAVKKVTKIASRKNVPQITTTNKNNKNTTDLRFQTLFCLSLVRAHSFVNERENAARLLLCCVATFGNILNWLAGIHSAFFFVSERSKGRKVFFNKKNISTEYLLFWFFADTSLLMSSLDASVIKTISSGGDPLRRVKTTATNVRFVFRRLLFSS